jgi:hypothetical protein
MKISEAIDAKIKRVRQPIWSNENAYLKLPINDVGEVNGVWCYLFDEYGQKALDIEVGSQPILLFTINNDDGYEKFVGEIYCTDIP